MSLTADLNRFLEANGVDAKTARTVSGKIRDNVRKKKTLSVEEVALAHEFISRAPASGDHETLQLQSLVERGASAAPRGNQLADKTSGKVTLKLGRGAVAGKVFSKIAHKVGRGAIGDKTSSKIALKLGRGAIGDKTSSKIAFKIDPGPLSGFLQPADIRQLAHQLARG